MELSHHVADHPATLDVGPIGAQAHLVHLVQDPSLDGLEAVPGVGDRS